MTYLLFMIEMWSCQQPLDWISINICSVSPVNMYEMSFSIDWRDHYRWFYAATYWGWEKWPPFSRWHFQMHFPKYLSIMIKISLKFVLRDPSNNIPPLVQIMAWYHPGDKPLSEPKMVSLLMHICPHLNELMMFSFLHNGVWPCTHLYTVVYFIHKTN